MFSFLCSWDDSSSVSSGLSDTLDNLSTDDLNTTSSVSSYSNITASSRKNTHAQVSSFSLAFLATPRSTQNNKGKKKFSNNASETNEILVFYKLLYHICVQEAHGPHWAGPNPDLWADSSDALLPGNIPLPKMPAGETLLCLLWGSSRTSQSQEAPRPCCTLTQKPQYDWICGGWISTHYICSEYVFEQTARFKIR